MRDHPIFRLHFGLLLIAILALHAVANDFFENEVRPLLQERCIECHSAEKQKGGLRLDSRSGWQQGGDTGPALVPGKPEESLLLKAVKYTLPDLHMPPKERLKPHQVAVLEKWIASGAPDPRDSAPAKNLLSTPVDLEKGKTHWAFRPLQPTPPASSTASENHPIDRLLAAERDRNGLAPNPRANRRTLIRRATFDLTGLPPTPTEIAAFERDPAPDRVAFASVVDRLLASPAYGERWGRHWLDVARYADTAGDGSDYPVREAVRYRDWVINALNRDLPFNTFLRQQIAGDILAKSSPKEQYADLVTATGFLAIGKRYGYKPSPDFQHLDFADAIDSIGRSLLGISLGCARCHDHKYEPITTQDYYALYGILQSTTWAFPGGEEQKRPSHFPSLLPPDETKRLEDAHAVKVSALDTSLAQLASEKAKLDNSLAGGAPGLDFEDQKPSTAPAKPWLSQGSNRIETDAQSPFKHLHPMGKQGVRVGGGASGDGIRYVLAGPLRLTANNQIHFSVDFRVPTTNNSAPGAHRLYLGRGVIQSTALDFSLSSDTFAMKRNGAWESLRPLMPGEWLTLHVLIDGSSNMITGHVGRIGDLTPLPKTPIPAAWDKSIDTFICDGNGHTKGTPPSHDIDNLAIRYTPVPSPDSAPVEMKAPTPEQLARLKSLNEEITRITKERDSLKEEPAYPVAYAVSEGKPTDVKVQRRGEPDKLGETVPRRFLSVLGGQPIQDPERSSGRLDLADWIVRDHAALTARVFVNRVWQWHFGSGIVTTPSDFGTRGEPPSHPELLEWLANEFIRSEWSVKSLHRLVLSSDAYAMTSSISPDNHSKDATNRWLWRANRTPLDAESLRDAMLFVAGDLDTSTPQPHPFPAVNTWKFTIHNPFHATYENDRRSIYLMSQRNRRHPFLTLFDAADPNMSVAARFPTITPNQTLYLMNSPFVAARAKSLATRLLRETGPEEQRIRTAVERTHGTAASSEQVAEILAFLQSFPAQLPPETSASTKPQENAPQLAAWTALSRVLLTSNAFLYVD